jgi:hypothetical protein
MLAYHTTHKNSHFLLDANHLSPRPDHQILLSNPDIPARLKTGNLAVRAAMGLEVSFASPSLPFSKLQFTRLDEV